jgi:PTH2 family peptidyl-tRNA hydrolase
MFKQAIVVREDLNLSEGKMASQVAHASLAAGVRMMKLRKGWFDSWLKEGQKKIVVKVKNLEHLREIEQRAKQVGIVFERVVDRGLTEVREGTITCIGIGPAPEELVDRIIGDLSLL